MNETLEKKQIELLRTLKERFKEEPRSWWQTQSKKYKTTWEVGNTYDNYPEPSEEKIVKYNFKAAISKIAALLLFIFFVYYQSWQHNSGMPYFMLVAMLIFLLLELPSLYDRKPRLIITSQSIWFKKVGYEIEWNNLMASYVEEDHSGDSVTSELLFFHYDQLTNTIHEIRIKLNECLEMNDTQICYYIEYWKIKTGNRTPQI
ncbi:hypothetical protein ESA94_07620 [Lacibacter luteus]|uniref:Uncharacterized protein n=1 Tax=Lacibacter luteus TaxID=2508719 RepID=A0A4Q1CIC0_9BACT|nr:hypothetical protein [Lacibacter luteus]RXK60341.1 hypothetical protein ESA94_07620 [Lacibacter luteus]